VYNNFAPIASIISYFFTFRAFDENQAFFLCKITVPQAWLGGFSLFDYSIKSVISSLCTP
jgi:hypothetical protein